MSPEAKAAFETGILCMRLLANHDEVSATKNRVIQLSGYAPSYITQPIKRITKGENDASTER